MYLLHLVIKWNQMHFKKWAVLFQSGRSLWHGLTPETGCRTMSLRRRERFKVFAVLLLLDSPEKVSVVYKLPLFDTQHVSSLHSTDALLCNFCRDENDTFRQYQPRKYKERYKSGFLQMLRPRNTTQTTWWMKKKKKLHSNLLYIIIFGWQAWPYVWIWVLWMDYKVQKSFLCHEKLASE